MQNRKVLIFSAIENNDINSIKKILQNDEFDLTIKNEEEETPIEYAAKLKHWECVLTIAKQRKFIPCAKYAVALEHAIKENEINIVRTLILAETPVTFKDSNNQTPIELAASKKAWDIVNIIAKHYSDKDGKRHYDYALFKAVEDNQLQTFRYLLEANAALTYVDDNNNSILHAAVRNTNQEIVKLLLKYDANDMLAKNNDSKTPIELASEMGEWDIVSIFLNKKKVTFRKGLHMSQQDFFRKSHYQNVLFNAVKQNNYYFVNLLLERKISCKKSHFELGDIGIYWAIKNNNCAMLELLLVHGANPDTRNKDGLSSYDLASQQSQICYEYLLQYQNRKITQQRNEEALTVYLKNLKKHLLQEKWIIFDVWMSQWDHGFPAHVKEMNWELRYIENKNIDGVLMVGRKILSILSKIRENTRRHPTVAEYYEKVKKELTDLMTAVSIQQFVNESKIILNTNLASVIQATNLAENSNIDIQKLTSQTTQNLYPIINHSTFLQSEPIKKISDQINDSHNILKSVTLTQNQQINEHGTVNHCFPTIPKHKPVLFNQVQYALKEKDIVAKPKLLLEA